MLQLGVVDFTDSLGDVHARMLRRAQDAKCFEWGLVDEYARLYPWRTEVFASGRDYFEASLWRWLGSEYFVQSVRQVLECGEFKHLPVKKERRSARDARVRPAL